MRIIATVAAGYLGALISGFGAHRLVAATLPVSGWGTGFLPAAAALLVSLCSVVVVGRVVQRIALAPVARLAAAARGLVRGDLSATLPKGSDKELDSLACSFDELVGMVRDGAEHLEWSVAERTMQFAAINDELLAVNRELQERRRDTESSLEAWRRSEEQLRLLLDSTAEAIYGTDLDGNCTFCNSACLRMLGYAQPSDLVGKNMHSQIHHRHTDGSAYPQEQCQIFLASEKGAGIHLEDETLWRADGSSFPVEYWSYPQFRDGRIVGSVATFLDITERVRVQEKLLKLSRAVENSPATVVITDRTGRIEYVNPKFTEIAGFLWEEAIGRNPNILNAGIQSGELYRELWDTILAGNEWRGEFCNKKKNGEIFWEQASISPIRDEKGAISHFVAVKEDVTERRRVAEELQRAKDAADAANASKSEFLANMSHEIRTPLNAIIGFSTLALESELPPEHEDYAGKINTAGKSLLGIINDILDSSKIEAGKLDLERTWFRMDETIANVFALVGQQALEKGLYLDLDLPEELAGCFLGDPLRLGQVVTNLLNNAIKFTERGGVQLTVALKERTDDAAELGFSVRDSGIGLTPEAMARLFQPFTQGDGSTTRRFGGTGLGLSISRQLVELMGGSIRADSEPGQGSVFSFTVRLGVGAQCPEEGERSQPAAGVPVRYLEAVRILLVEDNEVNRQLACTFLRRAGALIEVAVNGREAVRMVVEGGERFDLVLMDIQMPEMDGYRATGLIRAQSRFESLPIIAMTAHAMVEERQKILDAGMNDQIIKPIDARQMFRTISRHLRRTAGTAAEAAGADGLNGPPPPGGAPPGGDDDSPDGVAVPRIPGVDAVGALERLDGNRKLYLWLLNAFLESEAETANSVARALHAGDRGLAERTAHTTKGSAGSIGATRVMEAAATLEKSISHNEPTETTDLALACFCAELAVLLYDLAAALAPATDAPGA